MHFAYKCNNISIVFVILRERETFRKFVVVVYFCKISNLKFALTYWKYVFHKTT